jgi:16S rRNA processing protein RimM
LSDIEVCVGRIGKPHGVRGEVSVEVRSDEPDRRFAAGAVLRPRGGVLSSERQRSASNGRHPALPPALTVTSARWHQDRLLVRFEEVPDRSAAEQTRGALLYVDLAPGEVPEDPEDFYDHQLVGLTVEDTDGTRIGVVTEVLHHTAQELLVIRTAEGADGREVLVPFVTALVPTVDVAAGRLVVADRPGLIDGEPS